MEMSLLGADEYEIGVRVRDCAPVLSVELLYPRMEKKFTRVSVDLECVRAAMGITVDYDYERDGWRIVQTLTTGWRKVIAQDTGMVLMEPVEEEREVAFVPAWHPDNVSWEDWSSRNT
jgi:hypothetical protein